MYYFHRYYYMDIQSVCYKIAHDTDDIRLWSCHLFQVKLKTQEKYLSSSQKTDRPNNISLFNIHKMGHKRQFIAYISIPALT